MGLVYIPIAENSKNLFSVYQSWEYSIISEEENQVFGKYLHDIKENSDKINFSEEEILLWRKDSQVCHLPLERVRE